MPLSVATMNSSLGRVCTAWISWEVEPTTSAICTTASGDSGCTSTAASGYRALRSADVLLWDGSCIVHEEFKFRGLEDLKALCTAASGYRALRSSMPRKLNSSCTMQEPSHSSTSAPVVFCT